jgi:RNA polymerase sigma-70 factor (ECF subfamily)
MAMEMKPPTARAQRDLTDLSDAALLAAIGTGDEHALRAIYERHAPWLAVRLRRLLPALAVEDVLQETFLAVWRGVGRYAGSGEVGAWLWGIARRKAAMWLRSNGQPMASFDDLTVVSSVDPARQALASIDLHHAFAASGDPGSPGRDLARRVFIDDQPFSDIADELSIPRGTVKSRVFKIRKAMKHAIGQEDER